MSRTTANASEWKRKTLVAAIGAAMASTISLPAVAASTTVSTTTTTPISMTGTDTLTVTKSGSITLTSSAPAVSISGDSSIALTNDGTVSVAGGLSWESVIHVNGSLVGSISNTGTMSVTAQTTSVRAVAEGIAESIATINTPNPGSTGSVTNSGSITASATSVSSVAYASGVDFVASDLYGDVTNDLGGTISVTAQGVGGTNAAGAYGIIFEGASVFGAINNAGTLSAMAQSTSGGVSAIDIDVGHDLESTGTITNSGSMTATASSVNGRAYANGMYFWYNFYGNVLNDQNGTINATATSVNGTAVALGMFVFGSLGSSANPGQGTLTNAGTISAKASASGSSDANAGGIAVFQTLYGTIDNSGTITAQASGTNTNVEAIGIGTNTLDGTVTNSGTISGMATHPNKGYSVFAHTGSGLVSNQSGGLLSGNLYLGGSIAVTNAGTIALPEAAAAMINGNYTQSSSGVLEIGASSPSSYGTLTVGGTATIAGTVQVDLAQGNTLALGDTLSGVVSAGTLSGNFGTVTDNSLLYNFTPVVNGNAIDLTVVRGLTPTIAVKTTGNTPAFGLAGRLDTIVYNPGTYPRFGGLITAFNQMSSAQQMSNGISQLLPLFTGDGALIQARMADTMNGVVNNRSRWGTGLSSGDATAGGTAFWIKPFGSRSNESRDGAVPGYRSSTSGLMVGTDGQFSDSTRLGASIAYAHARLDSRSSVVHNRDQVYLMQLSGYGSTQMGSHTALTYQVAYSSNKNSGQRDIVFMNTHAISRYTSTMVHAGVGVEHAMTLGDATRFVPEVRVDYTSVKDPKYYEYNAGSLNLNVNSQTYKKVVFGVGGRLDYDMGSSSKLMVNLGAGYDTKNQQASVTATLAGAQDLSFVTYGLKPSRLEWHGGLGVSSKLAQNVSLTGGYNYAGQGSFHNQTLSLKVSWVF